jgi:hypothetical protein
MARDVEVIIVRIPSKLEKVMVITLSTLNSMHVYVLEHVENSVAPNIPGCMDF